MLTTRESAGGDGRRSEPTYYDSNYPRFFSGFTVKPRRSLVCEEAELCSLSIFWRSRFFFSIASFNLFLARLFIAGLYRVDLSSVYGWFHGPSKLR